MFRISIPVFVTVSLLLASFAVAQDSLNVRQLGFYDTQTDAYGIAVSGNYAYIAEYWSAGLRIVDISSPSNPVETGFYSTSLAVTVAVAGNYAYVAAAGSGLRVVDITNPFSPVEAGFYNTPGGAHGVAVAGDHAYVTADFGGLYVVNVMDPTNPVLVGWCVTPFARALAVSGNYAYLADWDYGGLRVVNISNPASPFEVGFTDTPGLASGVAVSGNYAYVSNWDYGLRVVDITDPTSPVEAGFYDTPGYASGVAVSGNYAYLAEFWSAGLRVVNITNPAAPSEAGFYDNTWEGYSVAVVENIAYLTGNWRFGIHDCSAAMGDPCVGDLSVTLTPNNPNFPDSQDVSACARIVPGLFTRIVVPVNNSTNVPTVRVTAGCASEPGCAPAEGWNLALPWQYDPATTSFFTTISRIGAGCCVTLNLDYVLPVELLSFSAVAGDAQVLLRWQTASETGSDRFEIECEGAIVHHTPAAGDASGHSYSWTDRNVTNGQSYHYALWSVETNGERSLLSETDATPRAGIVTVTEYALHGNYPNPFNPVTEIAFDLPEAAIVSLKVFDLMGREVAVLVNGEKPAGQHTVSFDARDLPSGVYVCRMTAGEFIATRKMMLVK